MVPPQCQVLVVKVAGRCNLNCNYCYMFNGGDLTYLRRPALMSDQTVNSMIKRVSNHCHRHSLKKITFIFHGGEPLLARPSFYKAFVQTAKDILAGVELTFALQTNGTLLTSSWCQLFIELGIGIGISLDGPKSVHDEHRVDHKGRGSFDRVIQGWDTAVSHGLKPGLLIVINTNSDPEVVYELLKSLNPRTVDFLFPDATYEKLPPFYIKGIPNTAHADWLLNIFQLWVKDDNPDVRIRIFSNILRSILGKHDGFDALGTGDSKVLVIESDGEIQPVDVLRFCKEGITSTKYNVNTHELDDAFNEPLIQLYYKSHDRLCSICENCHINGICGGGFLPHRYSEKNGFQNPSIYCDDLMKMITNISDWFIPKLPEDFISSLPETQLTDT